MSQDKFKDLELPRDCYKLSLDACTSRKVGAACRIKRDALGFRSRCIPNENYEADKFLLESGFVNFANIDEDNLEEELNTRNQLCKQLSTFKGGTCESLKGKTIGCEIKTSYFGKKTCGLSKEVINFFYKRRKKCIALDCPERHKKYSSLCAEHDAEFKEIMQEIISIHDEIVNKGNIRDDLLFTFEDDYQYLQEVYGKYLLENPEKANRIEEMKARIEMATNKNQCQAFNISGCQTGATLKRCTCKGTESSLGLFCQTHRKCYKDRIKIYKKVRDNLEKLCAEDKCPEQLKSINELYTMIRITTTGQASILKYQILETIQIIKEYNKL